MLPYLYDVLMPMLHPVRARTGDRLVVTPGHPTLPVVVVRKIAGGWQRVEVGPPNYGALLLQEDDAVIRARSSSSPPLCEHPLVRTERSA